MDRLSKGWGWIREKFGFRTVLGLVFVLIQLIPDWQARIDYWKDAVTKMAHASWFPTFLRIAICALGVGLIVLDFIQRSRRHTHHISIPRMGSAIVAYYADGIYRIEAARPPYTHMAYLVDVFNTPARPGKKSKGTGKVRAILKYKFDRMANVISPVAWCGEFFSWVEIEPGETKQIILAVASSLYEGVRSWNMVVNRRSNSGESVSVNTSHDIPFLQNGIIIIELISCETGSIISQVEVGWEWKEKGLISGPTYLKQLA